MCIWFQVHTRFRRFSPGPLQGRKRNIFQRGQSQFSQFFPGVEYDFSRYNLSILVAPKQISVVSKSDKQKKKKKKHLSPFHFQFSTSSLSNFPSFPLHFSFLPFPFFPGRSEKFPGEKCQGVLCPSACYATVPLIFPPERLGAGRWRGTQCDNSPYTSKSVASSLANIFTDIYILSLMGYKYFVELQFP